MTDIHFSVAAVDCPDPLALAQFYADLTGLEVEPLGDFLPENVTWIELLNNGKPTLGFQKIESYAPPTWPEGNQPQRLHFDFAVRDLDEGQARALALGATLADVQPGTTFRVFLDPIDHPFCLVLDIND